MFLDRPSDPVSENSTRALGFGTSVHMHTDALYMPVCHRFGCVFRLHTVWLVLANAHLEIACQLTASVV